MNILVTGAGGASGMYAIKMLKESTNHRVLACDINKYSQGFYLADEYFLVPRAEDKKFISEIISAVKKYNIDLILPNVDEELLLFSMSADKIPCKTVISPEETIKICQDKELLIKRFHSKVPVPDTEDLNYPLIIKPRTGRGSRNIFLVRNNKEVEYLLNYLKIQGIKKSELSFQQYLTGEEYTVDALFDFSGNLLVAIPRKRMKTYGGVSVIGKTVKNEKIIEMVKKISKELKFVGPINIQFKDDCKKIPHLLEINPRCSGGLPITYKSGVNFIKLLVDMIEKKSINNSNLSWKETLVIRYLVEMVGD